MNKKSKFLTFIALVLVVLIVVVKIKTNKQQVQRDIFIAPPPSTQSASPDSGLISSANALRINGVFQPWQESKISAEIQAKIVRVNVDVGSSVRAGQVLVQQDNSLLKLQLQGVQTQIESLEKDVERLRILHESQAIPGQQLDQLTLKLKSAQNQKAVLEEQIHKTTIRAPFSGVVSHKMAEVGAFAAPGMPLVQLIDISKLRFHASISEAHLSKFKLGDSHKITVDAYPESEFSGELIVISPRATPANQFPLQWKLINNGPEQIKAGMFAQVVLP